MPATVQKWGNSLGIRIPKAVAEQVHLTTGTPVDFETADGVLTIRPRHKKRHTLAGLLAKAKGRSPHRSLANDKPIGREVL